MEIGKKYYFERFGKHFYKMKGVSYWVSLNHKLENGYCKDSGKLKFRFRDKVVEYVSDKHSILNLEL